MKRVSGRITKVKDAAIGQTENKKMIGKRGGMKSTARRSETRTKRKAMNTGKAFGVTALG